MSNSFILLFKGALGIGGGFGALIVAILLIYWLYRKDGHGDSGCFDLLALPLLPFYWVVSLIEKGQDKLIDINLLDERFNRPPCLILKILVVLFFVELWILGIGLMVTYDISGGWLGLWTLLPLVFINLYILWLKVFFVWLNKRPVRTATIILIVLILAIIIFGVYAIKAYNYYTSVDYLTEYWKLKYHLI